MRKKRIRALGMLLAMCLLLSGCGSWKNYVYTDESLMREAAEALEEKYGEEFVIHNVWEKSQKMFFATCSPKDDTEVLFKADVYKDGRGVMADGYAQGIVAKEIKEKLEGDFQGLYDNCYTRVEMFNYYNLPEFDKVKEITLEEYSAQVAIDFVAVDVFIPLSEISNELIEEEWDLFSGKIQDMVISGIIPNISVSLYFVDDVMMEQCKAYYEKHTTYSSDFKNQLDEYSEISFAYTENEINKTYEEYRELRMEVETNE